MFLASFNLFSYSSDTERICLWALEEPTVSSENVSHTYLISTRHTRGCKNLPYCVVRWNSKRFQYKDYQDDYCDEPSDAKTMGLSGLDGSVKQNTSANPSEAALR